MDMIGIDGKTNFFEQRTTEYKKANLTQMTKNTTTFQNLDDNF
jgi:ribonucleotide reductase beta subunit family protein with ferritin-like domain